MKKTVVFGASENPSRYSYLAVERLREKGYPVVAIGRKTGVIGDIPIVTGHPEIEAVDTVTLYLNPQLQESEYEYILHLKPRRVIFNPGTENGAFLELLEQNNIRGIEACTLVMLGTGQY
ncbi:MAG: CoA-binding protein [Sediminibacterium sp.]|nr:CoA-binding protein [Sediminibacterium sp.]